MLRTSNQTYKAIAPEGAIDTYGQANEHQVQFEDAQLQNTVQAVNDFDPMLALVPVQLANAALHSAEMLYQDVDMLGPLRAMAPQQSVLPPSFTLVKRSWAQAFDGCFEGFGPSQSVDRPRKVVTVPRATSPSVVLGDSGAAPSDGAVEAPLLIEFAAQQVQKPAKRTRAKKQVPHVLPSGSRMCTRSQTKLDGFKAAPIQSLVPRTRKKAQKGDAPPVKQ